MYLSKLVLNIRNKAALIDIQNPYSMHQSLISMFPNHCDDNRILYRVEIDERKNSAFIIMQSSYEPDFDAKIDQGYMLTAQSKEFNPSFQKGSAFQFRLHANVVKKTKYNAEKDTSLIKNKTERKVLVPLYKDDEIINWLKNKAEKHGFMVSELSNYAKFYKHSRKKDIEKSMNITNFGVDYNGILTVGNPELMLDALKNGIGKGKAFGFGLLSLALVKD